MIFNQKYVYGDFIIIKFYKIKFTSFPDTGHYLITESASKTGDRYKETISDVETTCD